MFSVKLSLAFVASLAASAHAAQMTVTNQCTQTLWPGVWSSPDYPQAVGVGGNGGFQLNAGDTQVFDVPDNWNSGRIWGRTNCDFSKQDVQACETGSCIGGLGCTQPGIPPVSLAEFTLVPGGEDNYDVSNVDGSNLPIKIIPSDTSCAAPACSADLNANCPASWALKNSAGQTVGCKSSCLVTGSAADCCTGDHNTAATCPETGVASWSYFHNACPDAYAYAYDEHNGVLKTCKRSGTSPDYQVIFCP